METVDLTCQQLVELVTDYLEEALTEEERWRFLAHLDGCRGCQIHLDQIRTTVRALAADPDDPVAPGAEDRLVSLYRRWMLDKRR
jgi:anti-sigma factor RsiW